MPRQLVWFRSDLRTLDNTALAAAASRGPVIAVFLHSTRQWYQHGHGINKIDFWRRGVSALGEGLAELNIPLLQREAASFSKAPGMLLELALQYGIDTLHFNREYSLNEWQRDQATIDAFRDAGIAVHAYTDAVAFAPGELRTGKGEYYSIFTPFAKAWHREIDAQRLALRDAPTPQAPLAIDSEPLPPPPEQVGTPVASHAWPAGQNSAADRLERFLRDRAQSYRQQRDFPSLHGTSELSPYLALGMISYRQCLQAVMSRNGGHLADGDSGLTTWVSELVWREFYQHIVFGYPQICRGHPFQARTANLPWRDDEAGFRAWCEGRTGYPIIDAAMRQLVNTGWMHNRLRMVTAMFLSKHLLIDWRRGEAFFLRHLVDGEFAANNGGWQWAASTGTDSAPYFRIFNPTTQSRRFDAAATFIAKFVPELALLTAKARHAPTKEQLVGVDYPLPIVDHKAARERAIDTFKSLNSLT